MLVCLSLLTVCSNTLIHEADVSPLNPFRDELVDRVPRVDREGFVEVFDGPGLWVEVDESLFNCDPGIPGPCYV
jgi:D-galactarolactone cycloisomerase